MYYNLSKKEYIEYSKKFKKTFLGKSRYRDYIGCSILDVYFIIVLSIKFISGIITNTEYLISFNDLIVILLVIIFTSLNIITRIIYDRSLKEYIIEQKNKEVK